MNQIRGTPAYWKTIQSEVLAMVKQLGWSTSFLLFHDPILVEMIWLK